MSYRVYFGRLPESLSQDDFEKMLSEHGKARNIEWKSGYAYVDYKHGSDAAKTVQNLNGKEVDGNNILVELARNGGGGYAVAGAFAPRPFVKPPQPRPIRTPHRVRIENLSSRTRWMELKELLSLAGEVTFADTHKRKTGEGIVEFATRRDMEEAIRTFHNTNFYGKSIKIYDESPRGRSRSPSGQKSRSRHRSSERKRRSRSKSSPPREKSSSSRHRSRSPRRSSKRRSRSKDRSRSSRKRHSRSRTPKRNSGKKSKKSKRDSSRSQSKSPKRKKHKRSRSSSHSSLGNNNDLKRKSKKKKRSSSSSSGSNSSDSNKSK